MYKTLFKANKILYNPNIRIKNLGFPGIAQSYSDMKISYL